MKKKDFDSKKIASFSPNDMLENFAKIDFSYNWNNKLESKACTTFRLKSAKYMDKEELFLSYFKNLPRKVYELVDYKILKLSQVNEWIAYIDTGYSLEDFKKVVNKMYKNPPENTEFILMLLVERFDYNAEIQRQIALHRETSDMEGFEKSTESNH
jgi:hypothetical protein